MAVDAASEAGQVIQLVVPVVDGGAAVPTIKVAALDAITQISNRPEWPPRDPTKASDERMGVVRLGYLRKGDVVEAKTHIIQKGTCAEGWYELMTGGFVCGKSLTRDLNAKELADAPHPPLTDGPLPYEYALNLTTGTPLYRRKPTREERKQYERGLPVGKTEDKTTPSDKGGGDTPWYMKDGARKQVSLNDLQAHEGPVFQRMVKGFYLSLDKKVSLYSGKFWHTAAGLYAPAEHVVVHEPKTEFEGVHVGDADEKRKLPVGFITGLHARQYRFVEGDPKPKRGEHVDRFTIVGLTGQKKVFEDRNYYETLDGWFTRDVDGTLTKPGPPPGDLAPGEKWVDVNLSTQSLVAFEGDKPVYATSHLERPPRRQRSAEGPPHEDGLVPGPREAHLRDDGRRQRERRPVLDRGRSVDHVLQRQLRPARRLLAQRLWPRAQPRLREHDPARRQGALRLGWAHPAGRVAWRPRYGR